MFWKIAKLRKIGGIEFTLEPSGCWFTILIDFFSLSLSLCTSLNFSTEFLKVDCRHHHIYSVYFNILKKLLCEYNTLSRASQVVQLWRIRLPMQEMKVLSLGWEDPLQKEMANRSSILAWRIPWTEEPGGLYSPWGCKESDMTEHKSSSTSLTCLRAWRTFFLFLRLWIRNWKHFLERAR